MVHILNSLHDLLKIRAYMLLVTYPDPWPVIMLLLYNMNHVDCCMNPWILLHKKVQPASVWKVADTDWTFLWSKPEIRLYPYLGRAILTHFPIHITFPKLHLPHQVSLPFGLFLTGQVVSTPGHLQVLCSVPGVLSFGKSAWLVPLHLSNLSLVVPQRASSPCSDHSVMGVFLPAVL